MRLWIEHGSLLQTPAHMRQQSRSSRQLRKRMKKKKQEMLEVFTPLGS